MKWCVMLLAIWLSQMSVCSSEDTDLPDFEFSDPSNDYPMEDGSMTVHERMDTDRLIEDMADDEPSSFTEKEKRIRNALLRSTKDQRNRREFSQIFPILRSLSKQQRLALAALVSAQTSAKAGAELDLAQVEQMFGERKQLMLPIVLDIANLVRKATLDDDFNKNERISENGVVRHPQALRRSFPVDTESDVMAVADVEVVAKESNLKNDQLFVDDSDDAVITKPVDDEPTKMVQSKRERSLKYPTVERETDVRAAVTGNYHERKLNMTNFNGNKDSNDQHAMESETFVQITLPQANQTLSLEEYENRALNEINGTVTGMGTTVHAAGSGNSSSLENLPEPEMLIAGGLRYRTPYRKPVRTCELFGNVCLRVDDYPMHQIMGSIQRHKYAMSALLAEYTAQSQYDLQIQAQLQENEANKKRREDDDEDEDEPLPGGMCPSIVRYARPQKARSASGEWKYIVNTGQHTQTLRLEKCSTPDESCTYLTDNFKSRCIQIYNYHRLLSWDNARGLHVDIFKVPTCCSCHIDGFRDKFPPLNSYTAAQDLSDNYQFASTKYSTITEADEEDEEALSGSIAYQYSNGFKKTSKPVNNHQPLKTAKNRIEKLKKKQPIHTTLGTYLTPPANGEFDGVGSFKRSSSNRVHRRPIRKNLRDQSISGSEAHPNIKPFPGDLTTDRPSNKRRLTSTPSGVSTKKIPHSPLPPTTGSDMGKRVNYNYHPIIDFFGDTIQSDKEVDRIGHTSNSNSWRPMVGDGLRR